MTAKLYKAAEVCAMAQVQSYVLRSWEKEFPGIGVQKTADGPRLYRQSDVDQVLRIKQLVFGEGLTIAWARKRIEEDAPAAVEPQDDPIETEGSPVEALDVDARGRVAAVRNSLRELHALLSASPVGFVLQPPPAREGARSRNVSESAAAAPGESRDEQTPRASASRRRRATA